MSARDNWCGRLPQNGRHGVFGRDCRGAGARRGRFALRKNTGHGESRYFACVTTAGFRIPSPRSPHRRYLIVSRLLANVVNSALRPLHIRLVPEWELRALKSANPRLECFLRLSKRGFRPRHIVDVGAHKGQWSLDAHQVFPECAFTLIEPLLEMKPYLESACSTLKNARWIVAGAGETNCEREFTVQPRLCTSSFVRPEEQIGKQALERRNARVVTVDSVCDESPNPTPEIVKIDAEGLDLAVMRGSRKLIGTTELFFLEAPLLATRADQSFHSIMEFMKDNRYEPYDFTEFIRDPLDETLGAVEICFARRGGYLRTTYRSGW